MKLLQENYVKYGLIMTGIVVLCMTYLMLTGASFEDHPPLLSFTTMIAPAFVWFFALKAKKKELKNKLTFKQGILESFKIGLVFGITSPFVFIACYMINPYLLLYVRETYGLTGASDTIVVLVDSLIQFVASIIGGTIYGTIISFFLKTKKTSK